MDHSAVLSGTDSGKTGLDPPVPRHDGPSELSVRHTPDYDSFYSIRRPRHTIQKIFEGDLSRTPGRTEFGVSTSPQSTTQTFVGRGFTSSWKDPICG